MLAVSPPWRRDDVWPSVEGRNEGGKMLRGSSAGMLSLVLAVTFSLWSAAGIIKTNDYNLQVKRCSFISRKETLRETPSRSQGVFATSANALCSLCENRCCVWKWEAAPIIWLVKWAGYGCIVEDFICSLPISSVIFVRLRTAGRMEVLPTLGVSAAHKMQFCSHWMSEFLQDQ